MSSKTTSEVSEDPETVTEVLLEGDCDSLDQNEIVETCIVDEAEYEEFLEDDDSNIGSMVSIQSQEVLECEEDSQEAECEDTELIVPEVLEEADEEVDDDDQETKEDTQEAVEIVSLKQPSDSWPTLEILPGGVINLADKNDVTNLYPNMVDRDTVTESGDMMYACAKCSQSFKYLFCLVKHVKWHDDEAKRASRSMDSRKLSHLESKLLNLKRARYELDKRYKKQKVDVFSRIAESLVTIDSLKEMFDD